MAHAVSKYMCLLNQPYLAHGMQSAMYRARGIGTDIAYAHHLLQCLGVGPIFLLVILQITSSDGACQLWLLWSLAGRCGSFCDRSFSKPNPGRRRLYNLQGSPKLPASVPPDQLSKAGGPAGQYTVLRRFG